MGESEPSLPLYDLGVEVVETCSGVLDAYKKHPGIELAKVTLAVLGLRLDLVKSEVQAGRSFFYPSFFLSF